MTRTLIDKSVIIDQTGTKYYEYTYEVITPKKGKVSYYTVRRAYKLKKNTF